MSRHWHARLQLNYWHDGATTHLHFLHEGPLRVLRTLYPESSEVAHTVVIHPPGGVVEGDRLTLQVHVAPQAHALLTTIGATRFYRCDGMTAEQWVQLDVQANARLEWLPLETIAYPGTQGRNKLIFALAEGAQLIAWDVLSLGLPAAGQPFDRGTFEQSLHWPGVWRDEGLLRGEDRRLLDSPLGWAGHACLGTLVFASGTPLVAEQRDTLLQAIRNLLPWEQQLRAAATSPDPRVIVVRALAPMVEPIFRIFEPVWVRLRTLTWARPGVPLRSWRV